MSRYFMDWAAFDIPDAELEDCTTHNLMLRHPGQADVRLVVWHSPIPAGKTVRELAAKRVSEEMTHLEGYAILEQRETVWSGAPAIDVASRWRRDERVYYQRQAHFAPDDTLRSFSIAGPIERRAACDEWLEAIRTSLQLRSGA